MIKRTGILLLSLLMVLTITIFPGGQQASAVDCDYTQNELQGFGEWLDPCDTVCSNQEGSILQSSENRDYKGQQILSDAQLSAIEKNKLVYEAAGAQAGVPWQAIAVLHLRETGLKRINPDNGQGIYQDFAKVNGPYPPSGAIEVSEEEFLRQSVWAAGFFKAKATNPEAISTDIEQIKDAFFGYNGRAQQYIEQAEKLGFKNGYDGSPYVMNYADALRDPELKPTEWGQIKEDGGSLVYPANKGHGAFVVYSSLAGISTSDCESTLSGTLSERVAQLSYQEYELWSSGAMTTVANIDSLDATRHFTKYTYGIRGDWCAWFISWILKEAGKPVNDSEQPQWSFVSQFTNQAESLGFVNHGGSSGYKPKPGDLAVYRDGGHINVVVGYDDAGRMLTIGGNEGSGGNVNGGFYGSEVKLNTGYGSSATSYIEVK